MSIQQNFPAISPSLNLNFARSKTLDPRITFSRTSTATRVNEQGLVEVVSADIPRFDHEYDASTGVVKSLGLLVEEQRTNLIQRSEEFDDPSWSTSSLTITPNDTTAPNGTLTADRWQNTSTTGIISRAITKAASATTYTVTLWVKSTEATDFSLTLDDGNYLNRGRARFNLTTGTLGSVTSEGDFTGATHSITDFPDSWYRLTLTVTTNTQTTARFRAFFSGSGDTAYIWGAQLEEGAFPTSYIPTSGGTATRNPDNVSMTGDNFSDWYNQSEGSVRILAKTNKIYSGSNQFPYSMQIDDGTGSNRIAVDNGVLSSTIRQLLSVWENGSAVGNNLGDLQNVNGLPCAFAYKINDLAFVNGAGTLFTDDNAPIATTMNRLQIGSGSGGILTGHISQLTYYPRRLTNTQLQNLTK